MINCLFEFASVSIDLDDSTYLKGALYHPLEPYFSSKYNDGN